MTIPILIAVALQVTQPHQAPGPLDWLAGDWACRAEMRAGGPTWRFLRIAREGGGLSGSYGLERSTAGPPEDILEGRLRIAGEGRWTRLSYLPVSGRAVLYRLVRNERDRTALGAPVALFETRANVPAQRIAFRHGAFRMVVTTSRLDGSGASSTYYSPPGLHTGVGRCDGSR